MEEEEVARERERVRKREQESKEREIERAIVNVNNDGITTSMKSSKILLRIFGL